MEAEPFASFLRRRGASPSCSFLFRPRVHRSILRSWPSLHLRSLPPLPTRSTTLRCMAHEHAFQLRLDPLTGTSEWVVVENTEHESQNHKALLATTSYLDMLNDSYRNAAFHKAIRNTITKPCRVIDIGAGTGLLSMMAARTMEERGGGEVEGKVTAFESYLPMGKLMRKVLLDNGMEKKIKVVHKRSDEAELGVDVDSRAEVLVSEILDSELLGEGLIPTLQHAHDVLLVENPQVVPYRATIYGQLVESTSLWKLHDLHSCEAEISDGTCLVPFGLERIMCVKPKQHAMQCSAMSKELKLMSDPFRIFEFEFSKRPESQRKFNLHIRTTNDGIVHAIISWWVLQLDNTGCISYSTAPAWIRHNSPETPTHAPGNKDWCDHWKQCVWFVPGMGIPVKKDAGVVCQVIQDITSISFSLKNVVEAVQPTSDFDAQYPQITLPPERVGIYGDKHWRTAFLTAAKNAMQVKDSPFCLITDDSFFLSVVMARISRNACISSIFPGLKENASLYLDAVANANNFAKGRVEVIGKRASLLSVDDLHGRKVDLLIAEPFYYGNEGSLPWQNLRFWKERTLLDAFLSEEVLIMPCKGILKACAMSLPDLWRSRCSLKSIEGFDHSRVNEMLGACGDLIPAQDGPCLPYFIWQSGMYKVLSEAAVIMEFNFSECIQQCSGKTTIAFTESGMCHGFALWIDWVIDERNSIVISTGPDNRYWKQGVKLLNKPVTVNTPTSCGMDEFCLSEIEASFNPTSGQLEIQCNFGF